MNYNSFYADVRLDHGLYHANIGDFPLGFLVKYEMGGTILYEM